MPALQCGKIVFACSDRAKVDGLLQDGNRLVGFVDLVIDFPEPVENFGTAQGRIVGEFRVDFSSGNIEGLQQRNASTIESLGVGKSQTPLR